MENRDNAACVSNPHSYWMNRALELASKGLGTTSPNPPVGAVIVGQEGELLGEGFHERAGEPHAERRALADARARGHADKLRGATIYVTLEPCSSYGRTPPCTEGILEAGISRVFYGSTDPDTRHCGRADALLTAAGVQVTAGLCQGACDRLLRPWMHAVRQGRPWVLAKVATTLDARLSRRDERWLSCPESLAFAHDLRVMSDAILVGGQTVRNDNPSLTIRHPRIPVPAAKQQPWRIVVTQDRSGLPATAHLFTDAHASRTLVYESVEHWDEFLASLYRDYGIVNLMLECGGRLLRRFLEEGLVNEWVQILTPTLTGGPHPLVPADYLRNERHFEREECYPLGRDLVLRGIIR